MSRQLSALLLLAFSSPALAQTGGSPASDAKPAAKPERKICRTYEETGSIMGGRRECHTKAEWASIDQRNSDNVAASRDINGHASPMGAR